MALTSTLGSPGIEIREVDNSVRLDSSTATTIFIPGFASQGPVDEVMSIGTINDFESIYGVPTNAAERYFYYTVKAILDNSGNGATVLCSRLPYGTGKGDTVSNAYTMLAYPAVPVVKKKHYEKYSCLEKETIESKECYVAKFKIGNKVVKYSCPIPSTDGTTTVSDGITGDQATDPDTSSSWSPVGSYDKTYVFGILGDDGGYSLSYDNKVVAYCLNKFKYYDFDQYILDDDAISIFENAFSANPNTTRTNSSIPTELKEYYISVDDNMITSESLNFIKIGTCTIPITGAFISTEDEGFDEESFAAPELTIDDEDGKEYTANGLIATESIDGKYIVHASYTISTADTDPVPCGSIYMKFEYNSDIEGYVTTGNSACDAEASFVDAFEIAKAYDGQYSNQSASDVDNFSNEITYIVGSPVTYQISLQDYYKIITGESLKWSRKPFIFKDDDSTMTVTEGDDEDDTHISQAKFGDFDAIGHAAFITINTSRSIINNNFEGYYVGITDNMFVTPSDDYTFNAIEGVKITTQTYDHSSNKKVGLIDKVDNSGNFQTINSNRLSFHTDTNHQGSLSKVITRDITTMDTSSTEYDDTINMGLFKLTKATDNTDVLKLNFSLREKYNWSFGKSRLKSMNGSTKPVSYFVENIVEPSTNLTVIMNPYMAEKGFIDTDGYVHGKIRVLGNKLLGNLETFEKKYLLRNYIDTSRNTTSQKNKTISAMVPAKLAQSSIESWKQMVKQAGVTPKFIKNNFKNANRTIGVVDSNDYYNFHPLNSIIPFGTYTSQENTNKVIGELPYKIERALNLVRNDEQYPDIDIILEGGLGTIYVNSMSEVISSETAANYSLMSETGNYTIDGEGDREVYNLFDETRILQGMEDLRTGRTSLSEDAQEVVENYRAVQNVFMSFANSMQNGGRGDCFYISDVPRGVLIKGKDTKVPNLYGSVIENNAYDFGETVNHSFPTSVYYPIFHIFDSIVSSYMSTYAQWVKILDSHTSQKVWIPISGYIAANMAATDGTYGPWYASAGLRRGVINGVLDYAISPEITQRTDLYKICINSVPKIPNYGVTIWGIRTMSKKDSAFDQNTCRRTFLYMEKKVKQLLRYYIFEPNTSYTRLQIYNDIDPFLEKIKNNGGIYSYKLVTDATINTPDVINNGDLAVQIAAAPTRTAENIVVEFIANKYTEEISASESVK